MMLYTISDYSEYVLWGKLKNLGYPKKLLKNFFIQDKLLICSWRHSGQMKSLIFYAHLKKESFINDSVCNI